MVGLRKLRNDPSSDEGGTHNPDKAFPRSFPFFLPFFVSFPYSSICNKQRKKQKQRESKRRERETQSPTTVCPRCSTKLPPPIMLGTFGTRHTTQHNPISLSHSLLNPLSPTLTVSNASSSAISLLNFHLSFLTTIPFLSEFPPISCFNPEPLSQHSIYCVLHPQKSVHYWHIRKQRNKDIIMGCPSASSWGLHLLSLLFC